MQKLKQKLRKLPRHYFICHLQNGDAHASRTWPTWQQQLGAAHRTQVCHLPSWHAPKCPACPLKGWPNLWPSIEKFIKWQIVALCLPCPARHKCSSPRSPHSMSLSPISSSSSLFRCPYPSLLTTVHDKYFMPKNICGADA